MAIYSSTYRRICCSSTHSPQIQSLLNFNPLSTSSSSSSSSQKTSLLGLTFITPNGYTYTYTYGGLLRHFSSSSSSFNFKPTSGGVGEGGGAGGRGGVTPKKSLLDDPPFSTLRSAFLRYRHAVGLQVEAFWKRNYLLLLAIGGLALCLLLWRIMFGIATSFIGLSEGLAKYGFLAFSSAIVAFTGLYFRSRFTINPDKVYRIAMRRLNTSAGILEVMGAPLSGTDLRAYVMSGGGLALKDFKLKLRTKRCFLIFPIRGSERRGLVSVEVKKTKGQYDMKLLAVDVPMVAGPDQRFFLIGNEEEYQIGGGLISELRDPIVKAMAAEKEFEALDQQEEAEDAEREVEEAERKNREEIEKIEKDGA
ncbi:hypothetical protein Syun_000016 [Stephania yunnanensis]|uniref:Import inner membrane translocase subunit n=1 Tax=Stephania yunnanensis TaxID=152371 RepID=A0AAP0Q9E6_9MAGN